MPVQIRIIKYQGQFAPRSAITIDRDGGVIGRAMESAVVLNDEAVSRRHARICFEGGRYYLKDDSSNGTLISNRDLFIHGEKVELEDGDILVIGDHELEVHIVREESPTPGKYRAEEPPKENLVSARSDATERGAREDADARGARKTPEPSLLVEELSIDDFFKESEGEEIAVPGKEPVPELKVPSRKRVEYYSKGRSSGKVLENVDEFFKDVDDVPEAGIQSIESSPLEEVLAPEASAISKGPEEECLTTERIAKTSEQIPEIPKEDPRKLLDRFLKGAGFEEALPVADADVADFMENLGVVFSELANGLWVFLKGRAEMKAQIRISMTMVQPSSNNPLKFSPTLADAVKHLLKRNHPSFLEPIDAVREGFEDIMNHQLALNAGIQASLIEALNQFEPERFAEKNKDGPRLLSKGARLWKAYCDAFPGLREEALEKIFGKVFIGAYEQQLERLRTKKTGN